MANLKLYDRPFRNNSGETIPPYAVLQIAGWVNGNAGKDVFVVTKPNVVGKQYLINGPFAIAPGKMGWASRTSGVHALVNPLLSPGVDQELGATPGQWFLGQGSGFLVVGDVQASPTKRARVTIQSSSTQTVEVVHFELIEDKGYADFAKMAQLVLPNDLLDAGGAPFYVLDGQKQFYGKKAEFSGDKGFRGYALKVLEQFAPNEPGRPTLAAYRIIDMEGPSQLLCVSVSGTYSAGGTPCVYESEEIGGSPDQARRVPNTSGLTVYDPKSVAKGAQSGDKWWCVWEETQARYIFKTPLVFGKTTLKWGLVVGTLTAATGKAAANWGNGDVQFYDDSGVNEDSPVAVKNPFPAEFNNGHTVCCDVSKKPPRVVSGSCEGFA